jgi:hypothetical protein
LQFIRYKFDEKLTKETIKLFDLFATNGVDIVFQNYRVSIKPESDMPEIEYNGDIQPFALYPYPEYIFSNPNVYYYINGQMKAITCSRLELQLFSTEQRLEHNFQFLDRFIVFTKRV